MPIETFEDLLQAARAQPDPQRLLFVFARAELPDGASPEEVARFENGQGGALAPVMFVDKKTDELRSFAELVEESTHTGETWEVVFVGCLGGRDGREPGDQEAQQALELMVKSIQGGRVERFLAWRRSGEQIHIA
ncbi:ribonucleotide reductase subunit alpha [Nitrogeniibacter mangrovi]|uniref:Ribonucleotide reductase subunit alpha n=1 Tax=Nitrogeniibacter mangrovi TaxID=2016596 RepID=A0A6C1B602_9RHOO|nr:ribonucleotide reductase subunit alpha [Nitrogeniibacter mangrovi]QID19142.1 ribonucleotide reductase subunit alpha [Nitrogeniibacter mangrovi]